MSSVHPTFTRAATLALLLGSLAVAPAFAAPVDPTSPSGPPNSTVSFDNNGHVTQMTPDTSEQGSGSLFYNPQGVAAPANAQPRHTWHHDQSSVKNAPSTQATAAAPQQHQWAQAHSPADHQRHVEERIKTLHAKLMITSDQESEWNDVAQAMRDSEATVGALIEQRKENATTMNAVEDLESYQGIAQAHADGLKKVGSAFATLYNGMSPTQKKNADSVFDGSEGKGLTGKPAHKHHHKAGTPATK